MQTSTAGAGLQQHHPVQQQHRSCEAQRCNLWFNSIIGGNDATTPTGLAQLDIANLMGLQQLNISISDGSLGSSHRAGVSNNIATDIVAQVPSAKKKLWQRNRALHSHQWSS